MVKAADHLFIARAPDVFDPDDPYAAFEGRKDASVVTLSAENGEKLSEPRLSHPPVFDAMIVVDNRLYVTTTDGSVIYLQSAVR